MKAAYTVRELGRLLAVSNAQVHATADRLHLPYDIRHTVNRHGQPIVRRVYLRTPIDAALDEMGRHPQRRTP
jgi:hypothetical protein